MRRGSRISPCRSRGLRRRRPPVLTVCISARPWWAFDRQGDRVTGVKLSGGAGAACDACVIAVPPTRLSAILEDAPACGVDGLDDFAPMPIVDVHLWYDRPVLGCDFAALLNSPVQWVFEKSPGCSLSAADDLVQRRSESLSSSPARSSPRCCHRRRARNCCAARQRATRTPRSSPHPACTDPARRPRSPTSSSPVRGPTPAGPQP